MASPIRNSAWQIWVDTGGTFTDCLALSPEGVLHRAKVLSKGTLRAEITEVISRNQFRLHSITTVPEGFFESAQLRNLNRGDSSMLIKKHERSGAIELVGGISAEWRSGDLVEIVFDEEAPILAARLVTKTPLNQALPPIIMHLATTKGTNALLERKGDKTVLFVTNGFADLLEIGTQQRPDLFALEIVKPAPLYERVIEVPERMDASGEVVCALNLEAMTEAVERLLEDGFTSAAIGLMHSYRNPAHEQALGRLLVEKGFTSVSSSADLAPFIKLLPRTQTAVVNAYLSPLMNRYLDDVSGSLTNGQLRVMTSAGGLIGRAGYCAKDSLLSGPAGGVVGAATVARRAGIERIIAFDMGGTSTDVSRFDGSYEYRFEPQVGSARIYSPALKIETVASGGGSICGYHAQGLFVGPESGGAWPGPACYGTGGPLTITDVNVLLGRVDAAQFSIPILVERSRNRVDELLKEIRSAGNQSLGQEELLTGFLDIANERMAETVRKISVREGFDPRDYTLVSFGGAGGQHACAVADRLGCDAVLCPPEAGLLSAFGLRYAAIERFAERQILKLLAQFETFLNQKIDELSREALNLLKDEIGSETFDLTMDVSRSPGGGARPAESRPGALTGRGDGNRSAGFQPGTSVHPPDTQSDDSTTTVDNTTRPTGGTPGLQDDISVRTLVHLRLRGQETAEAIEYQAEDNLAELFRERYEGIFGYFPESKPIEIVSVRVIASTRVPLTDSEGFSANPAISLVEEKRIQSFSAGEWREVPVLMRDKQAPGAVIDGPAIVQDSFSTLVVEPGWRAVVGTLKSVLLKRQHAPTNAVETKRAKLVELELFTNRFRGIVEEMGGMLERTAVSTNVKERLDFSCALLDAEGELVVNAPHIPVHLGALGVCVRKVVATLNPITGDIIVTNHPAFGGSHLPDVTLIAPVHDDDGALIGYVANRAHHAELGGILPGSMPPNATCLEEEGVVISPMHLFRAGQADWDSVSAVLSAPPYPTRALEDNLADLNAQAAAIRRGVGALKQLVTGYGSDCIRRQMVALKNLAADALKRRLNEIADGEFEATEHLDDGTPIRVAVTKSTAGLSFDFTGTGGVHPGNFNATPAIVRSVLLYFLRLMIREPLPLNEGLLRDVTIRLPEGILNPPFPDDPKQAPAVVGGNVETSQRLCDTLIKAFRLSACSQGTMNNLIFGNERLSYYETIGGGHGAGDGYHGASAVHSHMTNTGLTDPELLEYRFPVRVNRFSVRKGSGGSGKYHGGDGIIRDLTFSEPVSLALLTQHRESGPFGLDGGEAGEPGRQRLIRTGGEEEQLGHVAAVHLEAGDRLILETPGGGGFGQK